MPDPITRNDVVRLLALAAAADQRTVGDEDITLWHGIARRERWTAATASAAIVEHYSARADRRRVDPATVTDRIRVIRGKAAESFELPRIPDGLPNRDYPAWLRRQLDAHVDAHLEQWATTGVEPVPAIAPPPAKFRSVAELAAAAPQHARLELERGSRRTEQRRIPSANLDTERRRAAARAELDVARPVQDTA